jgi:hypothetical protein
MNILGNIGGLLSLEMFVVGILMYPLNKIALQKSIINNIYAFEMEVESN